MNNEKRKSAEIRNRTTDDDKAAVARSSTATGRADTGKIETLQIQVAHIEQSSDQSTTTINDADADANDTNSMRIILPVFIENEQKYAQMGQRQRKIQSSPGKSMRRFSQDSLALEQQQQYKQQQQQQQSLQPPPTPLKVSLMWMCNTEAMMVFALFIHTLLLWVCAIEKCTYVTRAITIRNKQIEQKR